MASIFGKRLNLAKDGGILTSDSGALLLREVEAKTGAHSTAELIKQRRRFIEDEDLTSHEAFDLHQLMVTRADCSYKTASLVIDIDHTQASEVVVLLLRFAMKSRYFKSGCAS